MPSFSKTVLSIFRQTDLQEAFSTRLPTIMWAECIISAKGYNRGKALISAMDKWLIAIKQNHLLFIVSPSCHCRTNDLPVKIPLHTWFIYELRQTKYWHAKILACYYPRFRRKPNPQSRERTSDSDDSITLNLGSIGARYLRIKFPFWPESMMITSNSTWFGHLRSSWAHSTHPAITDLSWELSGIELPSFQRYLLLCQQIKHYLLKILGWNQQLLNRVVGDILKSKKVNRDYPAPQSCLASLSPVGWRYCNAGHPTKINLHSMIRKTFRSLENRPIMEFGYCNASCPGKQFFSHECSKTSRSVQLCGGMTIFPISLQTSKDTWTSDLKSLSLEGIKHMVEAPTQSH